MSIDNSRRCCNCRFFDDYDATCHLNPPDYIGDKQNEDGIVVPEFGHPFIRYDWEEWCSHWRAADESQSEQSRLEQIAKLAELDGKRLRNP